MRGMRRVRAGLLLPQGGQDQLPRIRSEVQNLLGWDDVHWQREEGRYRQLWDTAYGTAALKDLASQRSA